MSGRPFFSNILSSIPAVFWPRVNLEMGIANVNVSHDKKITSESDFRHDDSFDSVADSVSGRIQAALEAKGTTLARSQEGSASSGDGLLAEMQPYVQMYADVIAKVTGINVEIVDNSLVRIAGTGIYAESIGVNISDAGEIYKEVIRSHNTLTIESAQNHVICKNCPDRENCRELFSLATPIISNGKTLGVIGLVCFNESDRERVLEKIESYTAFTSFLAEALAMKAGEQSKLNNATHFLDLMLKVIDVPGQGIILFNFDGALIYSNKPARDAFELALKSALRKEDIKKHGQSLYEFDEFDVHMPNGKVHTVLGRLVELDKHTDKAATIFVFELPSRIAQLVSDISENRTSSGLDHIIGDSSEIRKLKDKATKVANSSSTVLITGESGTGKELLARAIHQLGPRRDNPFVAINCGGIPETLLESELFGYVSGAFTGASSRGRMGKFELAQGGVIFLDEISTMPLYMQVKLLRVLQEKIITRLGSNRDVEVNVRVIAASNENLQNCIKRNTFRDDLFYRLNVIHLVMPPLREREGDVAILADYFLEKYCNLFNKPKPRLRNSFLRLLEGYSWPGNVRELEHVLEYSINMMHEDGQLTLDCLPPELIESVHANPVMQAAVVEKVQGRNHPAALIEPITALEERAIRAALDHFGRTTEGKKKAAKALGLGLATLYRKMTAYSI